MLIKHRTLLVDVDVLCHVAASQACPQVVFEGEDKNTDRFVDDFEAAINQLFHQVNSVHEALGTRGFILCVSDPEHNFRKDIFPPYKQQRHSALRNPNVKRLKQYLIDEHGAVYRPGLEGDDVMGLLNTKHPDKYVIWTIDKDMFTVPGLCIRKKHSELAKFDVVNVTEDEANWFWMYQTLTGDTVDGYPGLKGVGPKKADAILEGKVTLPELWEAVVSAYVDRDQTEQDALTQAQMARILRHGDYDYENSMVLPWTPSVLSNSIIVCEPSGGLKDAS